MNKVFALAGPQHRSVTVDNLMKKWESKVAKRALKGTGLTAMAAALAACDGAPGSSTVTVTQQQENQPNLTGTGVVGEGFSHDAWLMFTQLLVSQIEALDDQNDLLSDQNALFEAQNVLLAEQIEQEAAGNIAIVAQLEQLREDLAAAIDNSASTQAGASEAFQAAMTSALTSLASSLKADLGSVTESIDLVAEEISSQTETLAASMTALGEALALQIASVTTSIDDMSASQQAQLEILLESLAGIDAALAGIDATLDDNSLVRVGAVENDPETADDNGNVYILSVNSDFYTGTDNADLFIGRAGADEYNPNFTADTSDVLDGDNGRDTLKLALFENENEHGLLPTTTNIEVLELTANEESAWDVSGMLGLEEIRFVNMRGHDVDGDERDIDLYGINNLTDITLSNTVNDVELHFVVGAAAGEEDEVTITLNNVDIEADRDADIFIGGSAGEVIETVNLVSSGSMTNDFNLVSSDGRLDFGSLIITGDAQLNATDDIEDYMVDGGIIDARGLSAEMFIRLGSGRDSDENLTLHTGSMDDLVVIAAEFDSSIDIHTGGGVDTIVLADFDSEQSQYEVDVNVYVGAQQTVVQFGYESETDNVDGPALFDDVDVNGTSLGGEDDVNLTFFFDSDLYEEITTNEDDLAFGFDADGSTNVDPLIILGNDIWTLSENAKGGLALDFDNFGGFSLDTRDGENFVEINTSELSQSGQGVNLSDDHLYIFSSATEDGGEGSGLVDAAISDFTDREDVASFLNHYLNGINSEESALFVINEGDGSSGGDSFGSSNTVHLYHFVNTDNDSTIDADELIYIARVTETFGSDAGITASDFYYGDDFSNEPLFNPNPV